MAAVVVQRLKISADCAGVVVSQEAEKEEADEKGVQVEVGVYATALKLSRRYYKNCT